VGSLVVIRPAVFPVDTRLAVVFTAVVEAAGKKQAKLA
jgi:hypothetical protein